MKRDLNNSVFPSWKTANIILEEIIAPNLAPRVSRDSQDLRNGVINILYFPDGIELFVPPEERYMFFQKIYEFFAWTSAAVKMEEVCLRFVGWPLNELHEVDRAMELRIAEFDRHSPVTFKSKFLEIMGVPPKKAGREK